jgi:hypothetical protein
MSAHFTEPPKVRKAPNDKPRVEGKGALVFLM